MKLITVILSIYFLALNIIPCNDSVAISNNSQMELLTSSCGEHHHTSDFCSPFCQCQCCHVQLIDFGMATFKPLASVFAKGGFAYFNGLGTDFQLSILQPPRA